MQEMVRTAGRAVDRTDQAGRPPVPAVITAAGRAGQDAFIEFFVATLRNPRTRRAYANAVLLISRARSVAAAAEKSVGPLQIAARYPNNALPFSA